uniref:(northern house mosquito) hypothetical protein n=1 Tax=Culex pipiens TaxID=7175 RepID=A0A8D8DTW6_CULPI
MSRTGWSGGSATSSNEHFYRPNVTQNQQPRYSPRRLKCLVHRTRTCRLWPSSATMTWPRISTCTTRRDTTWWWESRTPGPRGPACLPRRCQIASAWPAR